MLCLLNRKKNALILKKFSCSIYRVFAVNVRMRLFLVSLTLQILNFNNFRLKGGRNLL
jgi:hypothetical protein